MPSFAEINYSVRPKKNIERKFIFRLLEHIIPQNQRNLLKYIGFGSMWFVDFILAHRVFGIRDMTSIERVEYEERARFNSPFQCIDVVGGDSSLILLDMTLDCPVIAWLDYDTSVEGPVFEDVRILCEKAVSGSVLMVTVNAHRGRLRRRDEEGRDLKPEEAIREIAGALVPPKLTSGSFSRSGYPILLAEILFNHFYHSCRMAGRTDKFVPLLNMFYQDNAPMITVGGILAAEGECQRIRNALGGASVEEGRSLPQTRIEVPPLTVREKFALDRLLPCECDPFRADVESLSWNLTDEQIKAYHRYYLDYPIFGEIDAT